MKSLRYFAYVMMAAAAISLVSCKKEESYVPAEKETGLQVYFSYETPTTYNLSEEGSFTIPIYRNEFSSAATVQITTEADSPLTAPSEVSFASGQNRADIVVSYDFDAIEEGKSYAISFAVANAAETTLYGLSSLKVSASLPSAWIDFLGPDGKPAKVTFTQGHWGEIHTGYIHYTEQADGSRLCETYDEEGDISGKYEPGPGFWGQDEDQHLKFIWYPDKKTPEGYEMIQLPVQFYYTDPDGDMYIFDMYNAQITFFGYPATNDFLKFYELNPTVPVSYYDGNGGFYFFFEIIATLDGYGSQPDEFDTVGIADGYERTVDYNTLDWIKYLKGDVTSEFFDGEEWSDQVLSYSEADTTLFFMPGYFTENNGLAFRDVVSDTLVFTTDDKITDVDNDQDTGVSIFGQEVFVTVKRGKVTAVDEETGFPTFEIVLDVYTKTQDEEGNWSEDPVSDFGMVTETITFNKKAGYSYTDLSGMNKADYAAFYYTNSAVNASDGERYDIANTYFVDDGSDEDGAEWFRSNGFSGLDAKYWTKGDSLSVEWYKGFLYLQAQDINGKFVAGGQAYTVSAGLFDGKYFYNGGYLLGGLVEDDQVITFVNYPNNEVEYIGLMFADLEKEKGFSAWSEYILTPAGYAETEGSGIKMKSSVGKMRTAPGHSSKIGGTFTTPDGKQLKSAKRSEPQKNFRLQPKPVEKEVSGTKDFPSKSRNFKKKSCR